MNGDIEENSKVGQATSSSAKDDISPSNREGNTNSPEIVISHQISNQIEEPLKTDSE